MFGTLVTMNNAHIIFLIAAFHFPNALAAVTRVFGDSRNGHNIQIHYLSSDFAGQNQVLQQRQRYEDLYNHNEDQFQKFLKYRENGNIPSIFLPKPNIGLGRKIQKATTFRLPYFNVLRLLVDIVYRIPDSILKPIQFTFNARKVLTSRRRSGVSKIGYIVKHLANLLTPKLFKKIKNLFKPKEKPQKPPKTQKPPPRPKPVIPSHPPKPYNPKPKKDSPLMKLKNLINDFKIKLRILPRKLFGKIKRQIGKVKRLFKPKLPKIVKKLLKFNPISIIKRSIKKLKKILGI